MTHFMCYILCSMEVSPMHDTTKFPTLPTLAERVRYVRRIMGLTQQQLADRAGAGVTRNIVHQVELGKSKRPRQMEQIAKALDVTPTWLAFGQEDFDGLDAGDMALIKAYNQLPADDRAKVKDLIKNLTLINSIHD